MRDADWFWLSLGAVGTGVEVWALSTHRDHMTLSRSARRALRCHTKVGRAFTTITIGAGASWLANHLLTITPEE